MGRTIDSDYTAQELSIKLLKLMNEKEYSHISIFPDAPTERGVKHLRELTEAVRKGYKSIIAFVIQMDCVFEVRVNVDIHPEFGTALEEAKISGVDVVFLKCHVEPDTLVIIEK